METEATCGIRDAGWVMRDALARPLLASRIPYPDGSESDRHSNPHQRLFQRRFDPIHLAIDALKAVVAGEPVPPVHGTRREEQTQFEGEPRRALAGELGAGEVIAAQPDGRSGTDLFDVADADPSGAHFLCGKRGVDGALDHTHF